MVNLTVHLMVSLTVNLMVHLTVQAGRLTVAAIALLGNLVMSYVHRLSLALQHCRAYLRRMSARFTRRTAHTASQAASGSSSFRAGTVRARARGAQQQAQAAFSQARDQVGPRFNQARAQAQSRLVQAATRARRASAQFQGVGGSRLTRGLSWLARTVVYSVVLSVALSLVVFGIGSAVAKGSWHTAPRGFDQVRSISDIQAHCSDDQEVQVQGRLTNYLYKDFYEFTDEQGNSIEVELDDDIDWSPVHKDQLITIYGEVERNLFKLSIDAKGYRILEQAPQVAVATATATATSDEAPTPASAAAAPAAAPAPGLDSAAASTDDSEQELAPEGEAEVSATLEARVLPGNADARPDGETLDDVSFDFEDSAADVKVERISYELP